MKEEVEKAIKILKNNGVIIYPTDTIWGIGCDATSETAINKVFEIKNRKHDKKFIILLDDDRKLNKYVRNVPEIAWDILDLAISPTTIIYPDAINLPKNIISKDGSIAIRVVKEKGFVNSLIKKYNKPIVSTSANISGTTAPKSKEDIASVIIKKVNHVVNLETKNKKSSSIIKIQTNGQIEIIRK